jgi:hypothetical protein
VRAGIALDTNVVCRLCLLRLAVWHRGLERIQLGANGSSPVQQIDDVAELYGRQDADYLLTFLSRGGAVQG